MHDTSSYGQLIYGGKACSIFKVDTPENEPEKVLKILHTEVLNRREERYLKNEFNITNDLSIPGVRKALALKSLGGKPALELEYFEGINLKKRLINNPFDLYNFLQVAIHIVSPLETLHHLHIIHKHLTSENILVNLKNEIKLIDFGLAGKTHLKPQDFDNPEQEEGSLAYISPEQTGRINRSVDERSDLYSLGVIFYEMLTGQLPFAGKDTLELVYAHIAHTPVAPHVEGNVPQVLSKIILKLVEKNADDRYQSVFGLKHDLQQCLMQWEEKGEIMTFPLAENDFYGKFKLPQALYGREKETTQLLQLFESACNGEHQLAFISGYAGVGKTSLVQEVYKTITEKRGYFISGKFDQYQRDIPYYAWIQAFNQFVDLLLTENPVNLEKWKNVILKALDGKGKVLMDVVPRLEKIIGPQKEVPELDQRGNKMRFREVVKSFIFTITKDDHPLFIFIDDWQWADPASIDLLHLLMMEKRFRYLMITGAYRNNEVDEQHPLRVLIREFEDQNIPVFHIVLENLPSAHVEQLVCDTLSCSPATSQELSDLIANKTRGNPFFVRQMLQSIYDNEAISYEADNGSGYRWIWDIQRIQALKVTDNVVDLLIVKVKGLPAKTQEILQSAACIGTLFEIKLLSVISEMSEDKIRSELEAALWEDILVPNGIEVYSFAHDKIQQAVYSLIQDSKKQAVHYRAGRLMLNELRRDKDLQSISQEHIFDVVNQLIAGKEYMHEDAEKIELAELCLQAGKKAQASNAHQAAERFIQNGIDQLSDAGWKQQYPLMLSLKLALSDSKKYLQYFEEAEVILDEVLENAHTDIDKLHILKHKGLLYQWLNRFDTEYSTLLQAFHLIDIKIPKDEKTLKVLIEKEWKKVNRLLSNISISSLIEAPPMTNEIQLVNMSLMPIFINTCLTQNKMLHFQYFILKAVSNSLRYGHCKETACVYAMFCAVLTSRNHLQMSFQFALLTVEMIKKDPTVTWNAFTLTRAGLWGIPYGAHLRDAIPIYELGSDMASSGGESYYVWNVRLDIFFHRLAMGDSLHHMLEATHNIIKGGEESEVIMWQDLGNIERHLIKHLMDTPEGNSIYISASINDILVQQNPFTLGFYYHNQLQYYCWFPESKAPLGFIEKARRFHKALMTNIKWADFDFYASLFITQRFDEIVSERKSPYWEEIEKSLENLRLRAEACPDNFAHKYYLICAEISRIENNFLDAQDYYTKSVVEAEKYGFIQIQALAEELFADFYIEKGLKNSATGHVWEARKLYHQWGAFAKVKQLETRYPAYFDLPIHKQEKTEDTTTPRAFDFMSIIKAVQAISSEIVLSNLVEKMMKNVIESAGAEKGVLIENKDDHLSIQATGNAQGMVQVLQEIPVEKSTELPLAIVHFVARTRKHVVLDNATQNVRYVHDPYIQSNHPLSVLCFPVIRKEKLMAIFYLENNQIEGAFSAERLELLKILSTQIAISLENALLYANRLESEKIHEIEKSKSRFFANISHEFRTPLTLILGLVKKIKEGNFTEDEKQEQCTVLLRNAERLLQLINQLLDLSKLEAKNMRLEVAEHNVTRLMEGMVQTFVPLACQKNIGFTFRLPDKQVKGFLDADKLDKIVSNLLGNALKFTPENGEVWLEVKTKDMDDDWVQMRVKDNGPGIAQKEIGRIFDRFYQAGSSRQHGMAGSGLGLALTRELVELHKGKITVNSVAGKGLLFTVDLPIGSAYYTSAEIVDKEEQSQVKTTFRQVAAPPKATEVETDKNAKKRKQILVVEDHQDLSHFITGILKNEYKVSQSKDGVEGLERALKEIPDLVISDIMMPGMDGYSLCQNLKNDVRTSHIPVILLTARADVYSKIEGLETGADDYLTKPFNEQELLARVKNLIRQREKLKEIFAQNIQVAPQELAVSSQDQRFLQRVMEITEDQLSNPHFGVEDFCRKIGVSRAQLYRKLHALTGFSANEFIREMRLKRAAALIEQQFGSITEIAYETGFISLSYFSTRFQQRFGKSPKAYSKPFNHNLKS